MSYDPKSKDFDPYSAWLGIPPGTRPPTPEELVGVSPGETNANRIVDAAMGRKKRLDGLALSEHSKLADAISKEVADAVALLLKRAEPTPTPIEPLQAEIAVEVIPALPAETPVQATLGVPVEAVPLATVGVPVGLPVKPSPQAVVPPVPAGTVPGRPAQEEWRLEKAAQAAGIVVLSPVQVEPEKKRADAGSRGVLYFLAWLTLLPFRPIDALLAALAGEDNEIVLWFLRLMAAVAVAVCVVCGVLFYDRSAEKPDVAAGQNRSGGESRTGEPSEGEDDLLAEESLWEQVMLDADQEVEVAPDEEASGDSADPRTSKSEWTGSTPPYAVAPFGTGDAKAFQRQWAQHLDTRVEITNSIGMKLVLIPPGEFLMGSPRTDLSSKATRPSSAARRATKYPTTEPSATIADETPQHSVRINRPFYMGARDVTRAEYQRLIPAAELGLNTNPDLGDSAPVEFLSWDEAVAFCRRLSDQPDEKDAGRVYRLPREAEWEYACRAGTSTRHYAGDDLASLAASASQPKANAWGLRDMLGNVQQWCADWYGVSYYAASRLDDPEGPLAGTHRVVRGGGPLPANRRSALRHHETPKNPLFGFRVVCETASLPTGVADVKKPPPGKGPEPESPIASFDPSQAKQVQERWAKSLKIPVELSNSLGLRLVLVPPGEFTMGCDESDALPNEKPAHRVRITRPFYLGKCEVTWLQYSRIMPKAPGRVDPTDRSLPMTRVTWTSAVEFCRRLSEQPMESAVGRVYRLPTEAEWEYACRAGNTGGALNDEDANLGDYAWFDANSGGRPHPVGRKSPNPFGLHDMFGNVWEFCADWFADGYYRQSPVDDPQGPTNGAFKVLRGGAFKTRPNQPCSGLQPSHRGGIGQNMADDFIGFRVACSINERNAGTPTPNVKDSLDEPDE